MVQVSLIYLIGIRLFMFDLFALFKCWFLLFSGIRDYIHIVDLATGHLAALKKLEGGKAGCQPYNLGTGKGYSVHEMVKAFSKACGRDVIG